MTFLRKIGNTLVLLDDPEVMKVLSRISESDGSTISILDLQKKSGINKLAVFNNILSNLEMAGLIKKKEEGEGGEYSITGLYNVCKIDKWLDGTYRGALEADYFKNLILRLKMEYE